MRTSELRFAKKFILIFSLISIFNLGNAHTDSMDIEICIEDLTVQYSLSITPNNLLSSPFSNTIINDTICEGGFYDFNNSNIISTGVYLDTLPDQNSLDSIIELHLEVIPSSSSNFSIQMCEGQFYVFNSKVLLNSGIYTDTLINYQGCDSFRVLTLTVYPTFDSTFTQEICANSNYYFDGAYRTTTGIYTKNLSTINNCDSLIHLDLTVHVIDTFNISQTICEGEVYDFNGKNIISTGVYLDTLAGYKCDSIIKLSLIANPSYHHILKDTICESSVYSFGGSFYNQTGSYFQTLSTVNNCDSILQLDLTVIENDTLNIVAHICEGETYDFNGFTLSNTGVYNDSYVSQYGCDSTMILSLTVSPLFDSIFQETICENDSTLHGGNYYKYPGNYPAVFTDQYGCDSTITLYLSVLPTFSTNIFETRCAGDPIQFNGNELSTTGIYMDTLISENGCDSFINLNLTVYPISNINIDKTICSNEEVFFGNTTINQTGIYWDTLVSYHLCDSIVQLNLTVIPTKDSIINLEFCEGESISVGTKTYTQTGSYVTKVEAHNGCDSVIYTNLIVHPNKTEILNFEICDDQFFSFAGQFVNSTGTYFDTMQTVSGCDSLIILNLEVHPTYNDTIYQTICSNESIVFVDTTLSTSGTYSKTLNTINGCDSSYTIILESLSISNTEIDTTFCQGDSIAFGDHYLKNTGIYFDTLTNFRNCDSIITINLTVWPSYSHSRSQTICEGSTFNFGGKEISIPGTYYDSLYTIHGCDSIIELELTNISTTYFNFNAKVCKDEIFWFDGNQITISGTYYDTISNFVGCDSIIILNMEVVNHIEEEVSYEICQGDSVNYRGETYFNSTQDTLFINSVSSCDTVEFLNIKVNPSPNLSIEGNNYYCEGDSLNLYSNDNYSSYNWQNGSTDSTINVMSGGNMSLTVMDSNGCFNTTSILVPAPTNISFEINTIQPKCTVDDLGEIDIENIKGGQGDIDFYLNDKNHKLDRTVNDLVPGTYELMVMDEYGCRANNTIEIKEPFIPELDAEDYLIVEYNDFSIPSVETNFEPKNIYWSPQKDLSCLNCLTPEIRAKEDQVYSITVIDKDGCSLTEEIEVKIKNALKVYVPTSFSPNNDGTNDVFYIFGSIHVKEIRNLEIKDRWGEILFFKEEVRPNKIEDGWDGTFRGQPMPEGIYMYQFEYLLGDNKFRYESGTISIIK